MQVSIHSIVVENRLRRDLGDLSALMASMQKHGQMSPILITRDNRLIAGHRRLESARRIGWHAIEALCIEDPGEIAALEMEMDENLQRIPLTDDELRDGRARIERLRHPSLLDRIIAFFRKLFGPKRRASAVRSADGLTPV